MFSNIYPTQTSTMLARGKDGQISVRGVIDRVPIGRFAEKHDPLFFNDQYDHTDHNSE